MARSLLLVGLLVMLAGCDAFSASHSISASEFGRSCSVDSDCVPVFEGTLTCCPSCANSAINTASVKAYQAAVSNRLPMCSLAPPCGVATDAGAFIPPGPCYAGAACVAGTCQFKSTADAGSPG